MPDKLFLAISNISVDFNIIYTRELLCQMSRSADITVLFYLKKQMFDKPLPFFIRVWYYKTQKRMYVLKMCSKEMGGLIMANAAGTAQKMRRRKENHKFSRIMAVILGLIVTIEVMIAGGMIFNIDFHSADIIAVIMGFIVLYSGVVAVLTDN